MTHRTAWLQDVLTRVDGAPPAEGLPKHHKMATAPFVFLRGASQLFYGDISKGHLKLPKALAKIPLTMIMGDCHVSNFGFMTEEGSHGDRVVFAPNDFDDACMGHAAWDLARFCVSLDLCADYCRDVATGKLASEDEAVVGQPHVGPKQVHHAKTAFVEAYLKVCHKSNKDADYREKALDKFKKGHILRNSYKKAASRAAGGKKFQSKSSLAKAVDLEKRPLRFRDRPGRYSRSGENILKEVAHCFAPYVDDLVLDVVERLNAGTGSVNMKRYYLLVGPECLEGPDELPLCHIVEVKKQRLAAPLYFFGDLSPVNRLNAAHLTVTCQQRMQRDPDLVLDAAEWHNSHWLVRSRHHARLGIDPEDIGIGEQAVDDGFEDYAATCGKALALAHCRADRRSARFERGVLKHLPDAVEPLVRACLDYAEVVRADTQLLQTLLPDSP